MNSIVNSRRYFKLIADRDLFCSLPDKNVPYPFVRSYDCNEWIKSHARNVVKMFNVKDKRIMANTKKFKWNGYVNVPIPADIVDEVEAYMKDTNVVWADYNQAVIDGYRFSQSYDEDNKSFKASLTCYDGDSDNFGKAMSSFGSDFYTALAVVLYKHFHITGEDWNGFEAPARKSFG